MSKSNSNDRSRLSRRRALILPAAGIGAAMALDVEAAEGNKTASPQASANCSTPRSAVAKTQYGKVRGYVQSGVLTFKGIPYGQNAGGENRWLPAKAPKPWDGEYPALVYGANCPQRLHDFTAIEQSFLYDWTDGYMSEDMLKLNVWTPSLTGKRPVLVYFHGGGFTFGSAYELPSQDGAQLARHHDAVSVTVNHRLNLLGFLDVSEIGAFDDAHDHVHPETVDATVEPEPQGVVHRGDDFGIAPVQVWLLRQEQVEVVLAGRVVERPGALVQEGADPVVRRTSIR